MWKSHVGSGRACWSVSTSSGYWFYNALAESWRQIMVQGERGGGGGLDELNTFLKSPPPSTCIPLPHRIDSK